MRTDVICYFKLGWGVQRVLPELTGAAGPVNRDMGSVSAPFTLLSQYRAPQIAKRKEIPWLTSEEQTRLFFFLFSPFSDCDKHSGRRQEDGCGLHSGICEIISPPLKFWPVRVDLIPLSTHNPNTKQQAD